MGWTGQKRSEREEARAGFVRLGALGLSLGPLRPIAKRSLPNARHFPRVRLLTAIHPAKR